MLFFVLSLISGCRFGAVSCPRSCKLVSKTKLQKAQAHDSPQTIVNISKKSISLRILSSKCGPINNFFIRDVTRVKTTIIIDNVQFGCFWGILRTSPYFYIQGRLRSISLVHGNKAKLFCTVIRLRSKIWKFILHRNEARRRKITLLENNTFVINLNRLLSNRLSIMPSSKIWEVRLHRN